MVGLVGVAGLAGAGKTTAVRYLAGLTGGEDIYLGDIVLKEVRTRGLERTRDNEREVRRELREREGPAVMAVRSADRVASCLALGVPVFVDAIFGQAEFDALKPHVPESRAHVLAIDASFDVRLPRLVVREERSFTQLELENRDKYELERLGTGDVMSAARYRIRNEGSLEDFHRSLAAFWDSCVSGWV